MLYIDSPIDENGENEKDLPLEQDSYSSISFKESNLETAHREQETSPPFSSPHHDIDLHDEINKHSDKIVKNNGGNHSTSSDQDSMGSSYSLNKNEFNALFGKNSSSKEENTPIPLSNSSNKKDISNSENIPSSLENKNVFVSNNTTTPKHDSSLKQDNNTTHTSSDYGVLSKNELLTILEATSTSTQTTNKNQASADTNTPNIDNPTLPSAKEKNISQSNTPMPPKKDDNHESDFLNTSSALDEDELHTILETKTTNTIENSNGIYVPHNPSNTNTSTLSSTKKNISQEHSPTPPKKDDNHESDFLNTSSALDGKENISQEHSPTPPKKDDNHESDFLNTSSALDGKENISQEHSPTPPKKDDNHESDFLNTSSALDGKENISQEHSPTPPKKDDNHESDFLNTSSALDGKENISQEHSPTPPKKDDNHESDFLNTSSALDGKENISQEHSPTPPKKDDNHESDFLNTSSALDGKENISQEHSPTPPKKDDNHESDFLNTSSALDGKENISQEHSPTPPKKDDNHESDFLNTSSALDENELHTILETKTTNTIENSDTASKNTAISLNISTNNTPKTNNLIPLEKDNTESRSSTLEIDKSYESFQIKKDTSEITDNPPYNNSMSIIKTTSTDNNNSIHNSSIADENDSAPLSLNEVVNVINKNGNDVIYKKKSQKPSSYLITAPTKTIKTPYRTKASIKYLKSSSIKEHSTMSPFSHAVSRNHYTVLDRKLTQLERRIKYLLKSSERIQNMRQMRYNTSNQPVKKISFPQHVSKQQRNLLQRILTFLQEHIEKLPSNVYASFIAHPVYKDYMKLCKSLGIHRDYKTH